MDVRKRKNLNSIYFWKVKNYRYSQTKFIYEFCNLIDDIYKK